MSLRKISTGPMYLLSGTEISDRETAIDIHPHTSFSDGKLSIGESLQEAMEYGVYEKGAIEHGNPVDEDIDHPTTFLQGSGHDNQPYTSSDIFSIKFETIKTVLDDISGGKSLTDVDSEKLKADLELLKSAEGYDGRNPSKNSLNYTMVVLHGFEVDYNPAIEDSESIEEPIDSYEEEIINYLKRAESMNCGYDYILLSSHYVNTPYKPLYVKKDELFEDMDHDQIGDVLEHYRTKEIQKIESLSSKLGDMCVPSASGELMDQHELDQLQDFIYNQADLVESISGEEIEELPSEGSPTESLEIDRPGVIPVGAHPTLIERNEVLMDYFRRKQGLTTKKEIRDDLDERLDQDIRIQDVDDFLGENAKEKLYPEKELRAYYDPMVEASREADNFIFEINGKGVERQHPSVFWDMLDEFTFGSDSHRPNEQPERSQMFKKSEVNGDLVFLSEKWLSELEKFS